jgi:hypothetical protein
MVTKMSEAQASSRQGDFEPHFIIDLAEDVHQFAEASVRLTKQFAKSAAIRAFRYVATDGEKLPVPVLNHAGNLRGMVVSKRARAIYNITFKSANTLAKYERALLFASIAIELAKDSPKFSAVHHSTMSDAQAARMYVAITDAAILRGLTGIVPLGAEVIAKSLEGYCDLAELAGVRSASSLKRKIRSIDAMIETTHARIFSPEFIVGESDPTLRLMQTQLQLRP